jgi:CxxC motif-containing protein (DUF1111 family)
MKTNRNNLKRLLTVANTVLVIGIFALAYNADSHRATGDRVAVDEVGSNEFIRGDFDSSGEIDITDILLSLEFQFLVLEIPTCMAAVDADDSGIIDITDAIVLLKYLFVEPTPLPPPFPGPGIDPTPDLGCREAPLDDLPDVGSYGGPDRELSEEESLSWRRGRTFFDRGIGVSEGLGPLFNGDSCRGCHLDPVVGGSGGVDVDVVRFAFANGLGEVSQLESGPAASRLAIDGFDHDELHVDANVIETRQTPTILGLGLVDRMAENVILANADPDDMNEDGISGEARMVGNRIGRFGHKASVPSLADFAADALFNEIGLTVNPLLTSFAGVSDDDGVADPEVSDQAFLDMAFFVAHLAPPPRQFPDNDPALQADINAGEELFVTTGCADCHIPELAGTDGPVRAYSDFLLHDIADPARRFINEPGIEPHDFRTAPLWGLRDTAPYMHDGSAETILEAIAAHHGEAEATITAFDELSNPEKETILDFLESL